MSLLLLGFAWAPGTTVVRAGVGLWSATGPPVKQGVISIAIDPSNTRIIYAGTLFGRLFKSTNRGKSWTQILVISFDANVSALAIDPSNTSVIYAGMNHGGINGALFKSTDGGSNWAAADAGLANAAIHALAIDHSNTSVIYASIAFGGGTSGYVVKSTDGGASWALANTGLPGRSINALAIDPSNTSISYAGTSQGGVFKSTNGGALWELANTGFPRVGVNTIVIDPSNTRTIYVGTTAGVFKSIDGGGSWNPANNGVMHGLVVALAIDLSNTNTIYAGHWGDSPGVSRIQGGVFKSTNGGGSWKPVNAGLNNTAVRSLAVDPSKTSIVYAGINEYGMFKQQFVPPTVPPPVIVSATLEGKKLTISGNGFGDSPRFIINDVDRSGFILRASDTEIVFKAKPKRFGLAAGYNTFQVIASNGEDSDLFIFFREPTST